MTGDHYFTPTPGSAARPREIAFSAGGREYALASSTGVFSADRLDPGTAVLLRKAPLPGDDATGTFLDIGCGYGPITSVLAVGAPRVRVVAVDVNERARALAEQNMATLGVADRVVVAAPDDVDPALRFDQIWSNPPIHVGKAELHDLLLHWLPRLTPDGTAWLVVARHLGSDSLADWLGGQGFPTVKHASQKGFRVLRVAAASR
ncbi:class I SAM-dependent methyltransferase [Hamadaea tsunoensis]|uniref:class I SAM-dependent methyltransferase n=1 Tax=Hamadaea tsunoensis TaxID=53368 RepID=UPI00041310C1|nr:methyltransferase [Hamadaea tsunoensis]